MAKCATGAVAKSGTSPFHELKRIVSGSPPFAQWVRNAEAAGEITLKRGRFRHQFGLRPIADAEKPELLKEYLDRYASAVKKFFPVPAGSPSEAYRDIAGNYPVFELVVR